MYPLRSFRSETGASSGNVDFRMDSLGRSLTSREAEVTMGGEHSSEGGGGMAALHCLAQRWSTPKEVDRRHQARRREPLDASGTKP
ncbi:jg19693 [Pararge aegeria aegeria]|uniref:Jg19693 protein n=1 Tax=Pararge aegeria aegeria TaxID=348720 RepID=A0A8S4R5P1_9NEOP|nr:jg19693 [Pararge aegeria aegeria]